MCADGPCLVEVGSRCHGGEGTWLPVVQECIGYSQLDATLNCYLRPDRFDALPFTPNLLKQGVEAFLVSRTSGVLLVSTRKISARLFPLLFFCIFFFLTTFEYTSPFPFLHPPFSLFPFFSPHFPPTLPLNRISPASTSFAVCSPFGEWRCLSNQARIFLPQLTASLGLAAFSWSTRQQRI